MNTSGLYFLLGVLLCGLSFAVNVPTPTFNYPFPYFPAPTVPVFPPWYSPDPNWRNNHTRQRDKIHDFFKLFGWLERNGTIHDKDLPNAIKKVQKTLHEPETGVYDDLIESVMEKPHCGTPVPYNATDANSTTAIQRFVIWGPKWDHTSLTYRFLNYTSDLPSDSQRSIVSNAFAKWSQYIPVSFTPAAPSVAADIHIKFVSMGPSETSYAATSMLAYGSALASGLINITFNDDYNWSDDRLFNFTAVHEIGHSLGLSHSKVQNAIMWPFYDGVIRQMSADDEVAVHNMYGWNSPRWQRIDATSTTVSIVQVSSNGTVPAPLDGLYQLRSTGEVLWYNNAANKWVTVDNNKATVQITGSTGALYQRHADGSIYRYNGSASSWQLIYAASDSTVDIVAGADQIYQRRKDGWVARWSGSGTTWNSIDQPVTSKQIAITDKKTLYNLLTTGDIVSSEWPYTNGWTILDQNTANVAVAVGGEEFYKMQSDGTVVWLDRANNMWRVIDDSKPVAMYASGEFLYTGHADGGVWRYTGTPMIWEQLDNQTNSLGVIGDTRGNVWQALKTGEIWKLAS